MFVSCLVLGVTEAVLDLVPIQVRSLCEERLKRTFIQGKLLLSYTVTQYEPYVVIWQPYFEKNLLKHDGLEH